ncbi:class I SAM-dependent methyltransferase [Aureibacillus halotolerans]|uniref:Putative rRNA methylase n=1 Tax=Aureibacillus halotolerans TaxID=1508390 RepID=A0A4R6U1T1_9BACI|nr:class I SAM-dependent methyltransferase [Aureibacillus halotolerans]TDQ40290.1 putative rRNA methylase [Aureibacillus halotolerans]
MATPTILGFTHLLLDQHVKQGDSVIDMTAGNGHDTLKLASLVGDSGNVHAFDIQKNALDATKHRLAESGYSAQLIHDSHHELLTHFTPEALGTITAAVFNLGYLPGGDKTVITRSDSTRMALQLLTTYAKQALIIIVAYPGHEGGKEEKENVMDFCASLPSEHWRSMHYGHVNQEKAPNVFTIFPR